MTESAQRHWSAPQFHNLMADIADATDRVDQLLFDLLLEKPVAGNLSKIEEDLRDLFGSAEDITSLPFRCAGGLEGLVIANEGLVSHKLLASGVLDPLVHSDLSPADADDPDLLRRVSQQIALIGAVSGASSAVKKSRRAPPSNGNQTLGSLADELLDGAALVFFSGHGKGVAIEVTQVEKRSISEPVTSPVVMGPHEGFIEDTETNLALIRRRLRSPRMRVKRFRLGRVSHTGVHLLCLQGITDDLLVAEARRRLCGIDVDVILESNTVMELIRDAPGSPVPTMLRTERPDRVAAALAQGQIAILTDGSPLALLAPITLGHTLKAAEDYYQNWMTASIIRCIRLTALLVGVFLPAFYVALVTFHPEFIPPLLLVSIAASRENVPLPALGEVLVLLGLFEIIREAGVRVPQGIGSALTIGGTLVVGEAAVRAGLVSNPVIIITATVVIAFFAIPDYDMVQFSRFLVYPMLLGAGFLGIFGLLIVAFMLLFYLASIRSFGRPYLAPFAPVQPKNLKDSLVRVPWWAMNMRPSFTGFTNPIRQAPHQRPHPPRWRR